MEETTLPSVSEVRQLVRGLRAERERWRGFEYGPYQASCSLSAFGIDIRNLQPTFSDCNTGKGNWDSTD
jgi:hypothetical protein